MTALEQRPMQCLKQLPTGRLAQVLDFVEFLIEREQRATPGPALSEAQA